MCVGTLREPTQGTQGDRKKASGSRLEHRNLQTTAPLCHPDSKHKDQTYKKSCYCAGTAPDQFPLHGVYELIGSFICHVFEIYLIKTI